MDADFSRFKVNWRQLKGKVLDSFHTRIGSFVSAMRQYFPLDPENTKTYTARQKGSEQLEAKISSLGSL
jgi:hypothetical protein